MWHISTTTIYNLFPWFVREIWFDCLDVSDIDSYVHTVVYNSHILCVFAFSHQVCPVRWPILLFSESRHFQICDTYIYVCPLYVIVRYYGNLMVIFNSIISSNFFAIFPYMRNAILFLVFGFSCIINSFFYSFVLLLLCYFCISKLAFY